MGPGLLLALERGERPRIGLRKMAAPFGPPATSPLIESLAGLPVDAKSPGRPGAGFGRSGPSGPGRGFVPRRNSSRARCGALGGARMVGSHDWPKLRHEAGS